ncbi:hypothetical protein KDA_35570 [Dictyobacter alpinus]|uniref:Protein kinase domain-containing protein n=1 Tax=Dictyobacter alpinus TaxID=2014873 RepID=A0A402B9J3_9CHLR|nr:serine/threonine-protein kinase [Dictyobacter alpinus]GCE28073.1 hypothetical protein KDA_35570 [Dictyobacter alpinus]
MSDTSTPEQHNVRLLGRHGSTIAYCEPLPRSGREVVLKICFTPFMTPEQLQQIYQHICQEVNRRQKIKHPNVLNPLKVRKTWQGMVFVSLYAPAGSLQQFLGKPMAPARALAIIRQIGEGLQAAHEQKIVHGNLMPNNVLFLRCEAEKEEVREGLLIKTAARDHVAITDFYLPSLVSLDTMNRDNEHPQLRHYMAPEQFRGERSVLADQYALAAIAYELLTGQTPFAGSARKTLRHKHENSLPVAPNVLNTAVPATISQAIIKALAKNPTQRFASVQDFIEALETSDLMAIKSPDLTAIKARVETKKSLLPVLLLEESPVKLPESLFRPQLTRKRLLLAAMLFVLLIATSTFYLSGVSTPLLNGKPARLPVVFHPTVTQQVDIETPAKPTMSVTSTPTNLRLKAVPTPTRAPIVATPTPVPIATTPPQVTPTSIAVVPAVGPATVKPILECVQPNGSGGYMARFGYINTGSSGVSIPVGPDNMIFPTQYSSSLPTYFAPGQNDDAMEVFVSGNGVAAWMINRTSATALPYAPQC